MAAAKPSESASPRVRFLASMPEPENPENVGTGGGVFGMFQSGGSEEPKEKKFGLF